MNDLPALITAATALITALGGLITLVFHVRKPADTAHPTPPPPTVLPRLLPVAVDEDGKVISNPPSSYAGPNAVTEQPATAVAEAPPAEPPPAV